MQLGGACASGEHSPDYRGDPLTTPPTVSRDSAEFSERSQKFGFLCAIFRFLKAGIQFRFR